MWTNFLLGLIARQIQCWELNHSQIQFLRWTYFLLSISWTKCFRVFSEALLICLNFRRPWHAIFGVRKTQRADARRVPYAEFVRSKRKTRSLRITKQSADELGMHCTIETCIRCRGTHGGFISLFLVIFFCAFRLQAPYTAHAEVGSTGRSFRIAVIEEPQERSGFGFLGETRVNSPKVKPAKYKIINSKTDKMWRFNSN